MKEKILIISCLALFCATGFVIAQVDNSSERILSTTRHIEPLTSAQIAANDQIGRLDHQTVDELNAGQYAIAEDDARRSLTLGLGAGLSQELLAQALYQQGKMQEAFPIYRQIAHQGCSFPRNMLPYALLLLQRGEWAQALNAYNEALPQIGDADFLQGKRLLTADNNFTPEKPQTEALETDIHIALGYIYTSGAEWAIHDPDHQALQEYTKAIVLQPNSPLANLAYAQGLWQVGRKKEAVAAFQHVADTFTGDVKASAEDALTRYRTGANHS